MLTPIAWLSAGSPVIATGSSTVTDSSRRGWMTVLTDLGASDVRTGQNVARGDRIGRAGPGTPRVTVELRRDGRPLPVAQLIAG